MSEPPGFMRAYQARFNAALPGLLGAPESEFAPASGGLERLFAASDYAIGKGGKRIRPVLVYSAAAAVRGGDQQPALDYAAAAVEMIHCYSLVHDDLPAMDDDDLRRGQPSCHRAYDEATAILAGDGLQARAFELLTLTPDLSAAQRLEAVAVLTAAAGPRGMVGGQALDIAAVDSDLSLEQLEQMHLLKTGALIRSALALGAIVAAASAEERQALDEFGRHTGLAFQVVDDILDATTDTETLGKTGGKDADNNKPTYVSILGIDGARDVAAKLLASALASLQAFGDSAEPLRQLAAFIVEREN